MRPPRLALVVAIATCALAPGCIVVSLATGGPFVLVGAICKEPAPTLDAPESRELLSQPHGTAVVADGSGSLSVASFPGGAIEQIPLTGRAIAASGLDDASRVVYVREILPWTIFVFGIGKQRHLLILKSLVTGEERELTETWRGRVSPPAHVQLSVSGGRALYSNARGKLRLFDVDSGAEVAIPGLQLPVESPRLASDGNSMTFHRRPPTEEDPEDWGAITYRLEFSSGMTSVISEGRPVAFRPDGEVALLDRRGARPDPNALSGSTQYPWLFVNEWLAIYEGLASSASRPRSYFGLMWPGFERSIRLGSLETHETVTLIPRFRSGTIAFSPIPLQR